MLKFVWNTLKYLWTETNEEISSVFAQFLWTSSLFSLVPCKLFLVFQVIIYIFSFKKM